MDVANVLIDSGAILDSCSIVSLIYLKFKLFFQSSIKTMQKNF